MNLCTLISDRISVNFKFKNFFSCKNKININLNSLILEILSIFHSKERLTNFSNEA